MSHTNHAFSDTGAVRAAEKTDISPTRRRLLQGLGAGILAAGVAGLPARASASAKPADVIAAIRSRRSIREYTGEVLPMDVLQTILAAGMSAPSAQNTRPWHFVVLTPNKNLHWIDRIIPMTAYTAKAGAAVLVCVDTTVKEGPQMSLLSATCCVENMLLAAHVLGWGSVWVSIYDKTDYINAWRSAMRLPEHIMPLCVLPIGRPAVPAPPVDRTDASRIHYESW